MRHSALSAASRAAALRVPQGLPRGSGLAMRANVAERRDGSSAARDQGAVAHDTAAMSLAKIGELAHRPFRPFFATATCAGLKM